MSIQIDIPCTSVSIEKGTSDKPLLAVCEEARADVVIQQIKDELGNETAPLRGHTTTPHTVWRLAG